MFSSFKKSVSNKPIEKLTILTNQEASDRIDQQERASAAATTTTSSERKRKSRSKSAEPRMSGPTASSASSTTAGTSAADSAMDRMQRNQLNQFVRRQQNNLQWLLLAKKLQQSMANTVIAETASDLSKTGVH